MPLVRQKSDGLEAFRELGYREIRDDVSDGSQSAGVCPFCSNRKHKNECTFYINKTTKAWDCKSCGKSGGFQTYLQDILKWSAALPDRHARLQELAENRGLKVETLLMYDITFNTLTGEYLIPVNYLDGLDLKIQDIRRYQIGRGARSTAGCGLGILGWENVGAYKTLWVCEGEWDCLALTEALDALGMSDDLALSIPGARTFKSNWASIFAEKRVVCAFDADDPGRSGALRAYKILKGIAGSLSFVHWPVDAPDGYDVRDNYKENGSGCVKIMTDTLQALPPGYEPEVSAVPVAERYAGLGMEASEMYAMYQKWLHLPDTRVLDVAFGSIIANRQQGDPIWLFLVAPPGGTKTEIISSLIDAPDIVYKNTLGAKSLVSGQNSINGADPSLLPRLHEKILAIEDFTTLLSIPPVYLDEIFGILRSAFNGRYEREYGNGRLFRCDCHFGIIAGVTPAIEHNADHFASLGERFLSYQIPIPCDLRGRRPYVQKARDNRGRENDMRLELRATAKTVLAHSFTTAPQYPASISDKVVDLAQLTSYMRGVLKREKYGASKDITHEPFSELGTRLSKQYDKLIDGIARLHRCDIGENEYETVRRVAFGSLPTDRRKFLAVLSNEGRSLTAAEVSEITGLPRFPMTERIAETLWMLKMIEREKSRSGLKTSVAWRICDEFAEIIESTGIFKKFN